MSSVNKLHEVIQQYLQQLEDKDGPRYSVFTFGEPRLGGTSGAFEFHTNDADQPVLHTDRVTSAKQSCHCTGSRALYFEGALHAQRRMKGSLQPNPKSNCVGRAF